MVNSLKLQPLFFIFDLLVVTSQSVLENVLKSIKNALRTFSRLGDCRCMNDFSTLRGSTLVETLSRKKHH